MIVTVGCSALLTFLAGAAQAKVLVDLDASTQLSAWDFGTHYGGGIASTNNVNFDGTAAILTGQTNINTTYSAPAVYVSASRSESTGNFGVGDNNGSGWRMRLASNVSDSAKFYSDNLFAVFNGSFDTTNDTLDASSIYSSDMAAISNGTIRFVIRDEGNWYISESSPNMQTGTMDGPLTTNFSIQALSASWYGYDPTTNPTTTGVADIGAVATPAFTNIDFIGFHLEVVAATNGAIGAFSSCNFGVRQFSATGAAAGSPLNADLDATRQWLWNNPPGGGNRTVRKLRTDVIDSISTNLSNTTFFEYRDNWGDDAYCDAMTAEHPVLHYLRQAELNAVDDIRNTVVEQGVVIWQMYNMGIIVKTPSRCFAMDLFMRDAQDLVDVLDFAIVSHEHQDHTMPDFLDAMILAGKPVITTSYTNSTIVTNDATFQFGDIDVYYKIGSHGGASTDPVGFCQVDCGPSGNDFVILHTGDGGNYNEFPVTKPVDLFMFHVEVGMPAPAAIDHMQAQVASASHIMELGHAVDNWRWLYSYAYNEIKDYTQDEAIVLSWGERWEAPEPPAPPVLPDNFWTPSNILTEAWYDAADTNTITLNGIAVNQWQDKSGNGHHAIQSTAANQPAAGSNINGVNAVEFNPAAGVKYLTNGLEQLTTVSMYVLIDPAAKGANGYSAPIGACASGYGVDSGLFWPIEQYGSGDERNDVYYTDGLLDKVYCNGIEDSADHNFQPAILSHHGTALPTANLDYIIGQRSADLDTTFAYNGLMGEIIICPTEHDTYTRQKIEGYLAWKWGTTNSLSALHPYKSIPPTVIGLNGTVIIIR